VQERSRNCGSNKLADAITNTLPLKRVGLASNADGIRFVVPLRERKGGRIGYVQLLTLCEQSEAGKVFVFSPQRSVPIRPRTVW